ncbi:Transposase [Cordylochernes scorpioides]|uniref:ATP-dependent DNA helicase n=1 Tax=Cordylochernes scorpioides TaxID=51811 RepID=A0ABY6LW86_9ARAC|nr:Transposase [Cordylochernes scorpioides]
MTYYRALEIVDRLFRDILHCGLPFGGKVVALGGDFHQVLPVVPRAPRDEVVAACIEHSRLLPLFVFFRLTQNMLRNLSTIHGRRALVDRISVRVWRRRGERSNPAEIVERPTVRQRGIMVWGAIAYDSRSPLLRIQGTMTAQRYVDDVLRPVTLPYLQGVPYALYQQDNTRPHTARISQQALQDVQMLPWPPYSPDLSPIEHVWDIIGRRLHALPQPRSEDELWQMVEREWRAIPQDAIRTLIDSLPRRVAACIAVRGGPTCYKADAVLALNQWKNFQNRFVTGERYVQLLRENGIPILQDRQALSEITFMQDGGPPHISHGDKQLLKDTFDEDRVISRHFIHSGLQDHKT